MNEIIVGPGSRLNAVVSSLHGMELSLRELADFDPLTALELARWAVRSGVVAGAFRFVEVGA